MIQPIIYIFILALMSSSLFALAEERPPEVVFQSAGINAENLALIINTKDPLSIEIGDYYQLKRNIPNDNIVRVAFDPEETTMAPGVFAILNRKVKRQLPDHIQAYLLTWVQPFRVGCMSITSAFAFGYDVSYCATGCKSTKISPYAASESRQPYTDFEIRPAMMLAALDIEQARKLIDRGLQSTQARYAEKTTGSAYLIETSDKNRNVRKQVFSVVENTFTPHLPINIEKADSIKNKNDIMFYFTGLKFVEEIDQNIYLPGAMADHLTSTGGVLTGGWQMSALRWLEAGATGSYGTVVEPCNILLKFPNPILAIANYIRGDTLIEAYWKSVYMPGQGVFIGDPLAQPYKGYTLLKKGKTYQLSSPYLSAGYYKILAAEKREGPFKRLTSGVEVSVYSPKINLTPPFYPYYKIEPVRQRN